MWNRLPLKGTFPLRRKLLINFVNHLVEAARINIPPQFRPNAPRMNSGGTYATLAMPIVKRNGEQNIGCLRSTIGYKRLVRRALKIRILKINIRVAMPR